MTQDKLIEQLNNNYNALAFISANSTNVTLREKAESAMSQTAAVIKKAQADLTEYHLGLQDGGEVGAIISQAKADIEKVLNGKSE